MTQLSKDQPLEIKIRPAIIDDLPHIFHLGEKLFRPDQANIYRTWDQFEVTGMFNSDPEFMLVAEVADTLVGFAMGTVIKKTATAWNYGYLAWLAVEQAFAHQGVATMLFNKFKQLMVDRRVRILMVDTQADNHPAINFFENKGFKNPVDHIYMTLNLDTAENQ